MLLQSQREQVVKVAAAMYHQGMVVGTWGNVSSREGDLLAITPSGMDYEQLEARDIVVLDLQGRVVEGRWKPSSEYHLHCQVYDRYPHVHGIVHVHSPYAAAFAVAGQPIPAVLEETAQMLGGEIRVAPYARAGTPELAEQAVEALKGRQACLLANHGLVGTGRDAGEALKACQVAEKTAMVTLMAKMLGEIHTLSQEDIIELRAAFATYGQFK